MLAFIIFLSLLPYCHGIKKWILGKELDSCDTTCSTYVGTGSTCSPDASGTFAWPLTQTDLTTNVLPVVLSYDTLSLATITCSSYSTSSSAFVPTIKTSDLVCSFSIAATTPTCAAGASAFYRRYCPCTTGATVNANTGTFTLTSNTDVLMVDFDVTLSGSYYSCVSIASASASGSYTKQIGFNFKMVSGSTVANNIMEIFFTGGGVSHYFGGTGTSFDFANNSLASYPASFTPTSNAICMGSYTSGSINLPTGFTRICIGNGYFASSNSVQFIGQLQVYGFQTTTAVSVPATIPACQVVGGGYQLSGVLTKSPCPPGQYSMGGVLACTSCARGKYTSLYGQTSCSSCSAGTYQNSTGSSTCLSCPTGKYQTGTGQTSCISCGSGTYNSATGSTSSSACVSCSAGTFNPSTAQSNCSSCPTGTYIASTGSTACLACSAGKYNAGTGATACTNCTAGYYKATTGGSSISSCLACPAGYYSSAPGSTTCTPCPAYTKNALTGQSSLAACVACPLHTLNTYVGQSSCLNRPTSRPTSMPSVTLDPTPLPTSRPSAHPTVQPTRQPSFQPFYHPTRQPTRQPTSRPSSPTSKPTSEPSKKKKPTTQPTRRPTRRPSRQPSKHPSTQPTRKPTNSPRPSTQPSRQPTRQPSCQPSRKPTKQPTMQPSSTPTRPTSQPSSCPSTPSSQPTVSPSSQPSRQPSSQPRRRPSTQPTRQPKHTPTRQPSRQPSRRPSVQPSRQPTTTPTNTKKPTPSTTIKPTYLPTSHPSVQPTGSPTYTKKPTAHPTRQPTMLPSSQPSRQPTNQPSEQPTQKPSMPTGQPIGKPTYQPTSQPSFVPTNQPNRRPSRQPSRQPTNRPSNPSSQPTTKPSAKSTSKPTAKPTLKKSSRTAIPSVPSSQPTRQPSMPTSRPTKTYFPTIKASPAPTSRPTSRPTSVAANTRKPSQYYTTVVSNGTIELSPDEPANSMCAPVQLTIMISFSKTLATGSTFTVGSPGLTSGDCYSPTSGNDVSSLYLPAQSGNFTAAYYEGNIRNNFESSYITFTLLQPVAATASYTIVIDRSNELRRSCSANSTWPVSTTPYGAGSGPTGSLFRKESYPKKCFQFYSSLNFSNPHQQFPNGVNLTLYLAFQIASDMTIKVALPGFTNKMGAYGLNPTVENATDYVGAGVTTALCNLTWNSNFSWTGTWHEGSVVNNFKDSYFQLYVGGNYRFHEPFWVNIDRACNHLIPVCGAKRNSSAFTVTASSDYFYTEAAPITVSNPIGSGCDTLNKCHGNGVCNYCSSKCDCFDGYGSVYDLQFAIVQDFNPDCSSKACPRGRAIGNIFQNSNATNATMVSPSYHMQLECSANGLCDRSTGRCKCNPGFEGGNCGRMVCPGTPRCSGRGRCLSMRRLAQFSNALPLTMSSVEYVHQFNDTTWDADFGHMCLCDSSWKVGLGCNQTQQAEYFGPACQYRHCPTGDDPATTSVVETDCEGLSKTGGSAVGLTGNLCHVDCSNRGICDYDTGICSCFKGYTGNNCGTLAY